jgi:hypothetical protein
VNCLHFDTTPPAYHARCPDTAVVVLDGRRGASFILPTSTVAELLTVSVEGGFPVRLGDLAHQPDVFAIRQCGVLL